MQHHPLRISDLFEHGERIHAGATVTDYEDGVLVHRTFAEVADESRRLATALAALGVGRGDVVATLCWNSSHHIAAYFAVPGMAAVLCYTTGTTGDPKGVAYSHRSTYLHTLMISTGSAYGFTDADTALPVVPMFHANAWGWIHAAWVAGSRLVMSGRFLQAPHVA